MTKPTITQLWNGELSPVQTFRKHNPEIQELEQLSQRNLDKLAERLDEPLQRLLERYNKRLTEYIVLLTEQAFCDGFSLGMKLLSEALWESEKEA